MQGAHQVAQKSRITTLSLKSESLALFILKFRIFSKMSSGDFFPNLESSCEKTLKEKSKNKISVNCFILSVALILLLTLQA